jgi:hypothetical protein
MLLYDVCGTALVFSIFLSWNGNDFSNVFAEDSNRW